MACELNHELGWSEERASCIKPRDGGGDDDDESIAIGTSLSAHTMGLVSHSVASRGFRVAVRRLRITASPPPPACLPPSAWREAEGRASRNARTLGAPGSLDYHLNRCRCAFVMAFELPSVLITEKYDDELVPDGEARELGEELRR